MVVSNQNLICYQKLDIIPNENIKSFPSMIESNWMSNFDAKIMLNQLVIASSLKITKILNS